MAKSDNGGKRSVRRLGVGDRELARRTFVVMGEVFDEGFEPLGDEYIDRLLRREDFWALAAFDGDEIVGGLTGHTLIMTRAEQTEIFIYDLAVRPEHQRKGIGRSLIEALREEAARLGIRDVFVPADNEDTHALDFYRAIGGAPSPVTIFTFG